MDRNKQTSNISKQTPKQMKQVYKQATGAIKQANPIGNQANEWSIPSTQAINQSKCEHALARGANKYAIVLFDYIMLEYSDQPDWNNIATRRVGAPKLARQLIVTAAYLPRQDLRKNWIK